MNYLSPKKKRFVNFIRDFTHDNNRPPTFVEIMSGLDIRSLGTVNWYVNELEKEDVIRRMKGKNGKRALSVLEQHIQNRLPLLGLIAAGHPLDVFENSEYIDVPSQYIKPDNYVLRVNGNSMIDDQIRNGDYVIVKGSVPGTYRRLIKLRKQIRKEPKKIIKPNVVEVVI